MIGEELITHFGYLGLFIISLLAASIIPLSSELFVVLMQSLGYNSWLIGLVATLGNYTGALTVYYMGKYGGSYLLGRSAKIDAVQLARAEAWFGRYGSPILLLSWLPIVGDALCGTAGLLRLGLLRFSLWTILGKGWRYFLLLGAWKWIIAWWREFG